MVLLFSTHVEPPRNETPDQKVQREKDDREAKWNSDNGKIDALVMSEHFVKQKLKAPSSADFPYINDRQVVVVHKGGGRFIVQSYVDAQNAFGAKLRTRYQCELKQLEGQNWQLITLDMK